MQITVAVAESDVHLQRLPDPQCLVQSEPQQHRIGHPDSPVIAPPLRRHTDFAVGRRRQVHVETAAVGQDGLDGDGGSRSGREDFAEGRRVVAGGRGGLLGDLLDADHLVNPAVSGGGHVGQGCDAGRPGVDQPVADPRGRKEDLRKFGIGADVADGPVVVRAGMGGQAEQRGAVCADRDAELGVEAGVEVGQGFGVGLVEPVLESAPVRGTLPVPVDVIVDQLQRIDVLGEGRRHWLQAMRNVSVSSCGPSSP